MSVLNQLSRTMARGVFTKGLASLLLVAAVAAVSDSAWASPGSELARREYDKGNFAVALQKLQPLADAGDPAAENLLGLMYANGDGVNKDEVQAAAWYWKAATGGNTEAQLTLAQIYTDGLGVTANDGLADYWRWKAADAFQQSEKAKLEAEIVKAADAHVGNKTAPAVIHLDQCKMPAYKNTGYGYHQVGNLQILFLVGADGAVLEASLAQGTDWPLLDHDIINSFAKTCSFVPAKRDGKNYISVYVLKTSWTVEP